MNFVVHRPENVMAIDNAPITFDAIADLVEPNIEIVAWSGQSISGRIEYNDRPPIMEPFKELIGPPPRAFAPSLPLINAWLTAAASLPQPITLDQAIFIKSDVISDICRSKQRAPFGSWDIDDESVLQAALGMLPMVVAAASGGLVDQFNNVLYWIYQYFYSAQVQINDRVAAFDLAHYNVQAVCQATPMLTSVSGGGVVTTMDPPTPMPVTGNPPNWPWQTGAATGGPSVAAPPTINVPWSGLWIGASGSSDATIPWESGSGTASDTLTGSEASELMSDIATRNKHYSDIKMRKLRDVDALSSIIAVIDYDLAEGW